MRELVEEHAQELVDLYLEAAREMVVFAKYEGEVLPSHHPDLAGRIAVIERLLDRVYGKPRQAVELQGASESDAQPVQIVALDDKKAAAAAHDFLARIARERG